MFNTALQRMSMDYEKPKSLTVDADPVLWDLMKMREEQKTKQDEIHALRSAHEQNLQQLKEWGTQQNLQKAIDADEKAGGLSKIEAATEAQNKTLGY